MKPTNPTLKEGRIWVTVSLYWNFFSLPKQLNLDQSENDRLSKRKDKEDFEKPLSSRLPCPTTSKVPPEYNKMRRIDIPPGPDRHFTPPERNKPPDLNEFPSSDKTPAATFPQVPMCSQIPAHTIPPDPVIQQVSVGPRRGPSQSPPGMTPSALTPRKLVVLNGCRPTNTSLRPNLCQKKPPAQQARGPPHPVETFKSNFSHFVIAHAMSEAWSADGFSLNSRA